MENQNKCNMCNVERVCNCSIKGKSCFFKKIAKWVVILLVFGLVLNYAVRTYAKYTNPNTITITGIGEIQSVPNISTINFTVRETSVNDNTKSLQEGVAKKANAVFAKLKELGIEEKDIKTSNYSVNPKYDYSNGRSNIVGYEASQSVDIKIRNTENVSKVLDILAGEKVTEIYGPNFEVDDIQSVKDEARDIAIKDAKEKANNLAKALGVKIKRIVGYSDDSAGGYMPSPILYKSANMGMGGDAVTQESASLPSGEQKVSVNVNIIFQIEN